MKLIMPAIFAILLLAAFAPAKNTDTRLYEMRVYYCEPNRLDALLARFRNHTCKLFEKHGMTNVGYWVPTQNTDNKLIYVLSYPDMDARKAAWKAFGEDPDWKKARTESEADGKIVAKVESIYMKTTDFSPKVKIKQNKTERVFELRTYSTNTGKLDALQSRFRDHTVKLFKKHGMTNVAYWLPTNKPETLIYILAHESEATAKKSFDDFRVNPEWIKVRDASEANGKLNAKVESVFMKPTDFSQMK